jgi:hypothetical protein
LGRELLKNRQKPII